MGAIISILKTVFIAFEALLPKPLNPTHNIRPQLHTSRAKQIYHSNLGLGLLNITNARAWARQAALNQTIDQSLIQVLNLMCYAFDWPYAEIWAPHPTEFHSIHLQHYYVRSTGLADNNSLDAERAMRQMGFSTKNEGPFTLIWEVAGVAFVSQMSVWTGPADITALSTDDRKRLISRAGFKNCLAVPVIKNGSTTHCLSFFKKDEPRQDKDFIKLLENILDELANGPPRTEEDPDGNLSDTSVVSAA